MEPIVSQVRHDPETGRHVEVGRPRAGDLPGIVDLNRRYLVESLGESGQQGGYLGKLYKQEELARIAQRGELVIATCGGAVVAYYLIGEKDDPDTRLYDKNAGLAIFDANGKLRQDVAYPTQVCIDVQWRGKGLFARMLNALQAQVGHRYTDIYCSVSEKNLASQRAHLRHGWVAINTFEGRVFYRIGLVSKPQLGAA